jgi:hypothetical protein
MNIDTTREQRTTPRALGVCLTALGMTLTLAVPQAARAQSVTPPPVPTKLEVEPPNEAFLVGHAVGTQNYVCLPSPSNGRVAWSLFTPQATLFSDLGEQLITHFFSPNPNPDPVENGTVRATWQDSRDTSAVWAAVVEASSDPNFVAPDAIPWVLLKAVGKQDGSAGATTLSKTTFVQRLNTAGGAAPPTGCALPTDVGRKAFVPYTADYFFYTK